MSRFLVMANEAQCKYTGEKLIIAMQHRVVEDSVHVHLATLCSYIHPY